VKFVFFFFSEITLGGNTQSMCWSNKVSCSNTTREISRPNWIGDPLTTQFWFCWRLVQVEKKPALPEANLETPPLLETKKKKRKENTIINCNHLTGSAKFSSYVDSRRHVNQFHPNAAIESSAECPNLVLTDSHNVTYSSHEKISQTCYHIIIGSSFSFWLRLHLLRINTAICIQRGRLKM
jgi:hypothetical protein